MNGMVQFNSGKLSEMLGRDIADAVVLIAKNVILGNEAEDCSRILGCSKEEIQELVDSQDYKDVYLILASFHNAGLVETDLSYDDIEQRALRNLNKRIDNVKDVDQLVRIATMANRAQRRVAPNQNGHLEPGRAGSQIKLTLTRRMIEKLSGNHTREETQEISIHGKHVKPTFQQVEEFFGPINKPRLPQNYTPAGNLDTGQVTLEALMAQIGKKK